MKSAVPAHNLSGQAMGAKGRRTRQKLIETTIGLIDRMPLRDLKVVDITQAAATSTATFYVYFDTVIDVVLAAATELSQSTPEVLQTLDAPWSAETAMANARAFVAAYAAFWEAHRPLLRTRNLAAEEGDARFIRTRETAVLPLVQALAARIEHGKAEGRIAQAIKPYATAGTLLMLLERLGALGPGYGRSGNVTHADLVEAAACTVSAALGWPVQDG